MRQCLSFQNYRLRLAPLAEGQFCGFAAMGKKDKKHKKQKADDRDLYLGMQLGLRLYKKSFCLFLTCQKNTCMFPHVPPSQATASAAAATTSRIPWTLAISAASNGAWWTLGVGYLVSLTCMGYRLAMAGCYAPSLL